MDSLGKQSSTAAESLGPFERLDLSQRVGALQLMPENGANVLRLELAASIVSTLPPAHDLATISTRRWRRWLEAEPFGDPRARSTEDPACNPFTETVVFFGGSYTVLPGAAERSAALLQLLLRAIFIGDQTSPALSKGFAQSAYDLSLAALTLGNECATKAGLERDTVANTLPTDEIAQPYGEQLARLRDAVTFSVAALERQLPSLGVAPEALALLTLDAGGAKASELSLDDLPVYRRPILRIDGNYVLIAPGSLPAALTHAILATASRYGDLPAVSERFRSAAFQNVDQALSLLGSSRLDGPRVSSDPAFPATRARYRIDSDKELELLLLADPLDHFDPTTINGEWSQVGLNDRLEAEIRALEEGTVTSTNPPNGVLALVVFGSPGRSVFVGISETRFAHTLLLSPTDLDVIAHAEQGHDLLLWQYAKAQARLRNYARVVAFDALDEFSVWKGNGYTYYMSDERRPTDVVINPGTAIDMRIQARDALDIHGVPAANGHSIVEVVRFDKPDVPIYVPRPGSVATFSLVVEGLPLTLWVEAARTLDDPRLEDLVRRLIDMITYWIWQFEPHLRGTLERLAERFDRIVIEVDVVESESWFAERPASPEPLEIASTDRGLKLTFKEGTSELLGGGDNAGEREIVALLLEALHDSGRDAVRADDRPSENAIAEALDEHAPLGLKKKLILISGEMSAILDESELPSYRPLQDAVRDEWRDREQELLDRMELPPGPIAAEQRVPTLTLMVAEYFRRFEQLVATLSPDGVLEALVAYGERLVQRQERERRLTPTRVACFGNLREVVEELQRDGTILSTTAVAHRFVIEYVAARPPTGLRPFSLEAYDELIALAAVIVGWGLDSDTIHYGLADIRLTVLGSDRLGRSTTEYEAAVEDYAGRARAEQIMRSSAAFPSMFEGQTEPAPDPPVLASEFDAATRAEFGVSITQIAEFLEVFVEIGVEQPGPTKRLQEMEARKRVASLLPWSKSELDAAFSLLTLEPRAAYLNPPPGFARRDVYPWAFSRRLSYLARPLLRRETVEGAPELLWGTRALIRASEYLFRRLTDGRLKAESGELRSLQGRITNHSGEEFNDRVAEAYEAVEGLTVRRRVTSIAGRHIEREPGQPLGDIDVLVADRSSKELLLVETKDFSAARTPAEFSNEEKKLRKALKTHGERFTWLRAHVRDALRWLDIDDGAAGKWRVKQLVVVSGEVFTPGLRELPVRVITLANLRDDLTLRGGGPHS